MNDKTPVAITDERIRDIFMANGFTIKDGQTDLKPYVYAAARALLSCASPADKPVSPDVLRQAAEAFAKAHIECDEMEARDEGGDDAVSDEEYEAKTDAYNRTKAELIAAYRDLIGSTKEAAQ